MNVYKEGIAWCELNDFVNKLGGIPEEYSIRDVYEAYISPLLTCLGYKTYMEFIRMHRNQGISFTKFERVICSSDTKFGYFIQCIQEHTQYQETLFWIDAFCGPLPSNQSESGKNISYLVIYDGCLQTCSPFSSAYNLFLIYRSITDKTKIALLSSTKIVSHSNQELYEYFTSPLENMEYIKTKYQCKEELYFLQKLKSLQPEEEVLVDTLCRGIHQLIVQEASERENRRQESQRHWREQTVDTYSLAELFFDLEDWHSAEIYFAHAFERRAHCHGASDPCTLQALQRYIETTNILQKRDLSEKLLDCYQQQLQQKSRHSLSTVRISYPLRREVFRNVANIVECKAELLARINALHELATIQSFQGKYTCAEATLQLALQLCDAHAQVNTTQQRALSCLRLGAVYCHQRRWQAAEFHLLDFIAARRSSTFSAEDDEEQLLFAMRLLATSYHQQKNLHSSLCVLRDLLAIYHRRRTVISRSRTSAFETLLANLQILQLTSEVINLLHVISRTDTHLSDYLHYAAAIDTHSEEIADLEDESQQLLQEIEGSAHSSVCQDARALLQRIMRSVFHPEVETVQAIDCVLSLSDDETVVEKFEESPCLISCLASRSSSSRTILQENTNNNNNSNNNHHSSPVYTTKQKPQRSSYLSGVFRYFKHRRVFN